MSAQTIGTGAVVLTANADKLLGGLDKARNKTEKWAADTGKGAERAGGGAGGMVGKLLFGGAVGGAAGAVAGGVLAGLDAVGKGVEALANVKDRSEKYSNVGPGMQAGIDRADKGMSRIGAAFDEFLFRAAGTLAPVFEHVADVLEVVGYVGAEAFGALVDAARDVAMGIGEWLGLFDETGASVMTTQQIVMEFLQGVGVGTAYLWDGVKAGAGVVSYVAGVIVDGFGQVIQVIAKAAKQLDSLAKELPEAIRPEWIGKAANAMDGFGAKAEAVGAGMQKWGKDAIGGFGKSADEVNKWFDGMDKRFAQTDRLAEKLSGPTLGGAFQQNSTEAYSVVAKFQAGNMVADGQKRIENLAREQRDALNRIERKIDPGAAF